MNLVGKAKACPICHKVFTPKGNHQTYCSPVCYRKQRYIVTKQSNKLIVRARRDYRESRIKRKGDRWKRIFEVNDDKCARCNQQFPRCCYDLHHMEGVKRPGRDGPASIIHGGTDEKFEHLLKITVLLCANCHRIIHDNGKPYGSN